MNAEGSVVTLAVQPLDAWRELWVFKLGVAGWAVDVLPPALEEVDAQWIEVIEIISPGGTLVY